MSPWIVQVKEFHGGTTQWKLFMPYLTLFRHRVKYSIVAKGFARTPGEAATAAARHVPLSDEWTLKLI